MDSLHHLGVEARNTHRNRISILQPYKQTTDANFSQPVDMVAGVGMGPAKTLRGVILMFNIAHNNEHYGNIVVYTGLKGHVPPSMARTRMPRK